MLVLPEIRGDRRIGPSQIPSLVPRPSSRMQFQIERQRDSLDESVSRLAGLFRMYRSETDKLVMNCRVKWIELNSCWISLGWLPSYRFCQPVPLREQIQKGKQP